MTQGTSFRLHHLILRSSELKVVGVKSQRLMNEKQDIKISPLTPSIPAPDPTSSARHVALAF
jgi:hypothetical protein